MKQALTYDDISLVPELSRIKHRGDISLKTFVSKRYGLLIPLVASPMDTVCEKEMAYKMMTLGGAGCIHRFMTIEEQSNQVLWVKSQMLKNEIYEQWGVMLDDWHSEIQQIPIMAAIGVKDEDKERALSLVGSGANILLIDVAHGHHINVIKMIEWCKTTFENVDIIAGNIVTSDAAVDLENAGVDGLRVGIGGGSLCTTRIKTGFGVPNVTALEDISYNDVPIMADGGIRTSGDIAKALAVGADVVMLGSLLAGTEESPGKIIEKPNGLYKRYRGSASLETKMVHNQMEKNVEGESTIIPYKGGVKFIVDSLLDGVKSALSYGGASDLKSFKPKYVVISSSGLTEGKPHLLT